MSTSSFSFSAYGNDENKPRNKRRFIKKARQNSQDRHDLEYRGRSPRFDFEDDDVLESDDDLDLDFDEDEELDELDDDFYFEDEEE